MNNSQTLVPPIYPSPTEQIRFILTEFRGRHYVELRCHHLEDARKQTFQPTMKEICIPVEKFTKFAESIIKVNTEIQHHQTIHKSKLSRFKDETVPVI